MTQLSEYIPVKHAAPKADCIDLYLVAYYQLHTPNRSLCMSRRVTSYASSEALLYRSCELRRRTHPRHPDANDWRLPLFLAASMMGRVTSFFLVFSSFFGGPAAVLVVPDRQGVVFVLWAFAHVYTFLRKRSPTAVLSARADCDSQSQSNLFRPAFILSVSHHSRFRIDSADLARTCAVIVNVPDLKAYSSVAAKLLRRVTSYASSEALLFFAIVTLLGDSL